MTLDEFTDFIKKRLDHLYAEAMRLLGDTNAADDAVQQTWYRLCRRHETLDATRNPFAYACQTLQSVIHDMGRGLGREQRAGRVRYSDLADHVSDPESQVEGDSANLDECRRLVREALLDFTAMERCALRLFLAGRSRAEAIAQMGSGYDAALNRARKKMNDQLGTRRNVVLRLGEERLLALLDELLADSEGSAPNQS